MVSAACPTKLGCPHWLTRSERPALVRMKRPGRPRYARAIVRCLDCGTWWLERNPHEVERR